MSKDVTIVIPSYNRPRQLKRLLDYFSGYKIPILVADSTNTPFTEWKKYKLVKYFHYPNFPYAKKLPLIYQEVKTKYVLFCADDDFIVPQSINECVKFLNKNPDYNSAHGHYVFFEDKKNNFSLYPFYLESTDLDINSNSPSERITYLLSNYMQLLYAVTKTSDIKNVFRLLKKTPKIKNDGLVELFQAIILCITGKSKTLPILYGAREVTPNSARTHVEDLDAYFTNPNHSKEYKSWSNTIVNYLLKKEKISYVRAKDVVDQAVNQYLKNSLLYIPVLKIPLVKVQRVVNKYSFGLAKKIYNILRPPKGSANLKKHAFSKKINKIEFDKIKTYIYKYQNL